MKLLSLAAAAAFSALLAAPAWAATPLVNGGFETDGLSGWTFTDGFVAPVDSATDFSGGFLNGGMTYSAYSGTQFAQLSAGVAAGTYTLLQQTITVDTAFTISGAAAFVAFDEQTYDDNAFVGFIKDGVEEDLFARDIAAADVGDYRFTPWIAFTSRILGPGTYTLVAGVRNSENDPDNLGPSQLLVDSFDLAAVDTGPTGGVPEPASWALMIIGFGLAGGALRARRQQTAATA